MDNEDKHIGDIIEASDCKNNINSGKDSLKIIKNLDHEILTVCDIVSEEFEEKECSPIEDNMKVNADELYFLNEDLILTEHNNEALHIYSDGPNIKLATLIQNCNDLFISEKIDEYGSTNKLQAEASKIICLEGENKILFVDEAEDCVLEHKALDHQSFCDNLSSTESPTSLKNSISMMNINANNEPGITTVYENVDECTLSDDIAVERKSEYSYLKNKPLESKRQDTDLNISHENETLTNEILVSKTLSLGVGGSTSENTKFNEQDKHKFYYNLEKNNNCSDHTTEDSFAKLFIKYDDMCKMETYKNESSNNVSNCVTKQKDCDKFSAKGRVSIVEDENELDIHEAIRSNDESLVRQLLAEGVDPNEPDWKGTGDPPIVFAALKQNVSIVKALCEGGCDVNVTSVRGETALHMAVSRRPVNLQLLDTLLGVGCDANIQDKLRGCSALHCVSGFADDEPKVFRRLVAVTDINLRDHRQCTVLHRVSASSNNVTWINQLLKLGADPSLQNDRGETALCVALERGWEEGALALVTGGTDINLTNLYQETVMHVAARHNQASVVAALLSHGADVNAQDLAGNTALHLAAGRGYVDTVRQLISCPHLDLDTHNDDGATPLTCAVESGFISVVQMLVQAEQVDLQPALDAAKQGYRRLSQPEMCQLLTKEIARRQTPQI